ncbi:MAG: flavodoxin family protein [Elusimicrobia bacterium]|nr:flavodoxin family protein [Elusimicrobiota bacterium]
MKILAFNGSPRKNWNTAALLQKALAGAAAQGAETELIHLYDLDYKGCISCFACKLKGGKSYGHCAVNDGLAPVFKKIEAADALLFGSPVYLGHVTGEMHSFLERLVFQYLTYGEKPGSLFGRRIKTGFIYTMNVPEEYMKQIGYEQFMAHISSYLSRMLGACEGLCCFDTLQFEDYSKYEAGRFDPAAKAKRRREVFPLDCQKAFELGKNICEGE